MVQFHLLNDFGTLDLLRLFKSLDVHIVDESTSGCFECICVQRYIDMSQILEGNWEKPLLLFNGISEPATVEPKEFQNIAEYLKEHNRTFWVISDKSDEKVEKIKEFCSFLGVNLFLVEGFRALRWGTEDQALPPELITVEDIVRYNINQYRENVPVKFLFKTRRIDGPRLYTILSIIRNPKRLSRFEVTGNVGNSGRAYNFDFQLEGARREVEDYLGTGTDRLEDLIWYGFWNQEQNGSCYVHEDNLYSIRKYFYLELVGENSKFQTEKVFKPMLWGIPCFYLGSAGTIKRLHEQGFRTFDKYWSESYDNLSYSCEKVDAIFRELDKLLNKPVSELREMYEDMQEIFLHNARVLETLPESILTLYKELNT